MSDTQTMKKPEIEAAPSMTDSQIVSLRDAPAPAVRSAEPQSNTQESASIVGESLYFKGELSVSENLVIEGTVEGSIKQDKASLTVTPKGRLLANVEATKIFVEGKVKGDLHATESVKVRETSLHRASRSRKARRSMAASRCALRSSSRGAGPGAHVQPGKC